MSKGIDIRATSSELLFRAFLQDASGAKLTTGTTTLAIYEVQMADGTLKSYDFNDNTFKTTALTTATLAMTHRTGNNATVNTGVWTARLATLTGFTAGNIYFVQVNNTGASPADQTREFQFGGAEGDLTVTGGNLHVVNIIDNATSTRNAAVVSIASNAITDTAIQDAALNGKGDWPTQQSISNLNIHLLMQDETLGASVVVPLSLVKANTDLLATNAADSPNAQTAQTAAGTAATNSVTFLARLGAFTGTGVNTVLGFLKALLSKTATLPSDVGGTFNPATDSTEALAEAMAGLATSGGAGLTGPSSVTLTFHDAGGDPVANVEFTVLGQGAGRSSSLGIATFGLPNGTYTLIPAMTDGVLFAVTSLVINGTTSLTVTGTGTGWAPATEPGQSRCYLRCYDQQFNVDPTATVTIQVVNPASTGGAKANELVVTCDEDGDVIDPVDGEKGVLLGANVNYRAHRGPTIERIVVRWVTFTPTSNPYNLPAMLGFELA